MLDPIVVQYLGFQAKDLVREYSFSVREAPAEARAYTLTIDNEAFVAHRVRYQDAPSICLSRLRTELATGTTQGEITHFHVDDLELAAYQGSHKEKAHRSFTPRKPE